MNLIKIPAWSEDGELRVVVEAPRGSALKLKYEPELQAFVYGTALPAGLTYPFDWGFVPGTEGEDGDPVDALVVADVSSHPGVVIPCRLIGMLELDQQKESGKGRERNDRLIGVPVTSRRFAELNDVADLSDELREELERFFLSTTFFSSHAAKTRGWRGPKAARKLVDRSIKK